LQTPFKEHLLNGFRVKVSVCFVVYGYTKFSIVQTLTSEGAVIADQIRCRKKK